MAVRTTDWIVVRWHLTWIVPAKVLRKARIKPFDLKILEIRMKGIDTDFDMVQIHRLIGIRPGYVFWEPRDIGISKGLRDHSKL